MADEPFGFSLAKLKPANKETAKHKITEPMTNLDEFEKNAEEIYNQINVISSSCKSSNKRII